MNSAARWMVIGASLGLVVALFAYTAGWFSPGRLTQARLIAALQGAGGPHPGFRRNHAKGMCFSGAFDSTGAAAAFSKAEVFRQGRVPLIGRFALAGAMPFQSDKAATVRSMALRLMPVGGAEWRTGMNNIPVFAVNSAAGFYEQLLASRPDPATGKPDPQALRAFAARHPEYAQAMALIKARPISAGFADSTFNSLDTFRFVDAAGHSVAVRWTVVPLQAAVVQANSPDDDSVTAAVLSGENRLFDDLIVHAHERRLRWRLLVILGSPSDTVDATVPWPDDRRRVEAGILTIEHVSSEDDGPCNDINFDPLVLPPGIDPSDDPLLSARSAVYALSHSLRSGERALKPASAVKP